METVEELSINANNRQDALKPVVNELREISFKIDETNRLLCELIKRTPQR
jgi:hypothetical protein